MSKHYFSDASDTLEVDCYGGGVFFTTFSGLEHKATGEPILLNWKQVKELRNLLDRLEKEEQK